MIRLSPRKIKLFQKKILTWYAENKRDLPWRYTRDPYKILVSEVMSQQTQINRVVPKYEAWIQRFPTVYALAKASTREVLHYWSGLGYNRRALYLKRCAETLVEISIQRTQKTRKVRMPESQKLRKSDSLEIRDADILNYPSFLEVVWPQTEKELRMLPGIGEYTAHAVLCFAFDKQIAVVDTNVRRIILTQFQIANVKTQMSNKNLQEIADQLLPHGHAYEWNQALMDYAATMLKHEKIPIPKQSPFKNSDRYFRGQVIKYLLQEKYATRKKLIVYFGRQKNPIHEERLSIILNSLLKDSFIWEENGKIELK